MDGGVALSPSLSMSTQYFCVGIISLLCIMEFSFRCHNVDFYFHYVLVANSIGIGQGILYRKISLTLIDANLFILKTAFPTKIFHYKQQSHAVCRLHVIKLELGNLLYFWLHQK